MASIDFSGISTTLVESSGSVTRISESPDSLTTRPVKTWPESVAMMRGAILVGDDPAGFDDRLDQVLDAEPAGGLGQVGPGRAAVAAEAVADDAARRRERSLAVLEIPPRFQLRARPSASISSFDHSRPGPCGLGSAGALYGARAPVASIARRSESVAFS